MSLAGGLSGRIKLIPPCDLNSPEPSLPPTFKTPPLAWARRPLALRVEVTVRTFGLKLKLKGRAAMMDVRKKTCICI